MNTPAIDNRSNRFVASFQIDGLCSALRQLVPHGLEVGPASRQLLKSLRDAFVEAGDGFTVNHIPEITEDTSSADLLVIAETLRVTMIAFLTPEEVEEKRSFGFNRES